MTEEEASEIRTYLLDIARSRRENGIAPAFADEIIRRLVSSDEPHGPGDTVSARVQCTLSLLATVAFNPGRDDVIEVLKGLSEMSRQQFSEVVFIDYVTDRAIELPGNLPPASSEELALRDFVNERCPPVHNEFEDEDFPRPRGQ